MGDYESQPEYRSGFTGEYLVGGLGESIQAESQREILSLYKELMGDADSLKELQQIVDMSNLGKSMWESQEKIEKFKELANEKSDLRQTFGNALELLGDFNTAGVGLQLNGPKEETLSFVPKTNQGTMVGTAVSLGRNLFFDYYPYYDPYIKEIVENIAAETSTAGNYQVKEEIFQDIKRLITSNESNGLFLGNVQLQRESLLLDKEGNTSISTYIADLLNEDSNTASNVVKTLQKNTLLTSMKYEKGVDGEPNLVLFDNTGAGNISEETYYNSLRELLLDETVLPSRVEGETYTVQQLAQELIAYSHITGGVVGQAVQFHKFIPLEYYQQIETTLISKKTGMPKSYTSEEMMQAYDPRITSWDDKKRLAYFTTQYFQNNPDKASYLAKKNYRISKDSSVLSITNPDLNNLPTYIKVPQKTKSKKKSDKTFLYKETSEGQYTRIEIGRASCRERV